LARQFAPEESEEDHGNSVDYSRRADAQNFA
jgi:hypothetical protein